MMGRFECDLGEMAKDILSRIQEASYDKENIDACIEVAVSLNAKGIYNTAEIFE